MRQSGWWGDRRAGLLAAGLVLAAGLALAVATRHRDAMAWRPRPDILAAQALARRPEGQGQVGTEHPHEIMAVDRRERWVALCQARQDDNHDGVFSSFYARHGGVFHDQLRPYLVVGQGPGEPLDAYVGADDSGRYVAVIRQQQWVVIDVDEGREWVLRRASDEEQAWHRLHCGGTILDWMETSSRKAPEARWFDPLLERLIGVSSTTFSRPPRSFAQDATGHPLSEQGHVLREARSPTWTRASLQIELVERRQVPYQSLPAPLGPLRWQPPASGEPSLRGEWRVARTTVRQGDCAVYLPLSTSVDRGEVEAREHAATGGPTRQTITTSPSSAWDGLKLDLELLSWFQGGFPGGWEISSPLQDGTEQRVALVARGQGKRYEATVEQIIEEFVAQAGDEPVTDGWPVWRSWVGFLNGVARAEGIHRRFVLDQKMGEMPAITVVDSGDVCARTGGEGER